MKNKKFYLAIGLVVIATVLRILNFISSTEWVAFVSAIAGGFGLAHTITDLNKKK